MLTDFKLINGLLGGSGKILQWRDCWALFFFPPFVLSVGTVFNLILLLIMKHPHVLDLRRVCFTNDVNWRWIYYCFVRCNNIYHVLNNRIKYFVFLPNCRGNRIVLFCNFLKDHHANCCIHVIHCRRWWGSHVIAWLVNNHMVNTIKTLGNVMTMFFCLLRPYTIWQLTWGWNIGTPRRRYRGTNTCSCWWSIQIFKKVNQQTEFETVAFNLDFCFYPTLKGSGHYW